MNNESLNNETVNKHFILHPSSLIPLLVILIVTFFRLYQLPTLPPGLNFDEAGNGVAAFDILQGEAKLWWRIGGGKEPLWPYLIALSTIILDNIPLALRLPAALAGILTVATVYPLMLVLFRRQTEQNYREARMVALLTMLGLALSAWHLHFSRLGFRAVLFPLLATLGFYFFWRGIAGPVSTTGKIFLLRLTPHEFLSSLFIALAFYAYLAARLLWLVPILFFVLHWLVSKSLKRPDKNVQAAGSTRPLLFLISKFLFLLLIFLSPLIIYFLFNPADLFARSATVSIFNPAVHHGDFIGTAWRTLTLTLGTFLGLTGDANPLVNLPHQPALPIFLAPFFLIGLAGSFYRIIRSPASVPSPYLFLLTWWLVMLFPALLAPEGAPHHLRLIGTLVPAYALVAIGMAISAKTFETLLHQHLRFTFYVSRSIAYLLPITGYLFLVFHTYTTYFVRWPTLDFTLPFDRYAVRLADDIAHAPSNTAYVLPMDVRAGAEARHYTLDYLLACDQPPAYTYLPVDERYAKALLSQAAEGNDEIRVVRWTADKHHQADAKEIVTYLLETNAQQVSQESFPVYDVETYTLYRKADFDPDRSADFNPLFTLPAIDQSLDVTFDNLLRLDAAFVQPTVSPGEWLPVALTLAPLAQMDADYKASLRLTGPTGERVAQKDRILLHNFHQGTSLWPPETVNEYYLLPVPPETPPGQYGVSVVIYHPDTQTPLVADSRAEVLLGEVQVK
jgi:hypothetical protein